MAKILLVEDDKSLREIYGVRLMAEGYEIVSAGDGEEALAMAIKERPDLIVSDVMMPKISGFDMLDILRSTSETKDVKVIMMTALSSDDQRARGESLGADRYLVKSQVGIEDVVRTVHDVLGDSIAQAAPAAPSFGPAPMPVNAAPSSPAPEAAPLAEPLTSAPELPTPTTPDVAPATPPVAPPVFETPAVAPAAPLAPAPEAAPEAPASAPVTETALEFEETPAPSSAPVPTPQTDSAYATPEPAQQPAAQVLSELPTPTTPDVAPATPPVAPPVFETPAVAPAPAPFSPTPEAAPEAPVIDQTPQAPPVFNPTPETPAPAPFTPTPKTMAPGPDSALPLPTAPFSTPAPASLGQRIIEPLTQPQATNSGNDIASQIAQELNASGTPPVPPAS